RVLLAVHDHPFRQQRAAARDDARQPVLDQRQVLLEDAGMDGEVVDALLRLVLDLAPDDVVAEVLDAPAADHAETSYGADRNGAVIDDRLPAVIEVPPG